MQGMSNCRYNTGRLMPLQGISRRVFYQSSNITNAEVTSRFLWSLEPTVLDSPPEITQRVSLANTGRQPYQREGKRRKLRNIQGSVEHTPPTPGTLCSECASLLPAISLVLSNKKKLETPPEGCDRTQFLAQTVKGHCKGPHE